MWSCGANDNAALGRETENVPDPKKKNKVLEEDELCATPFPIQSLVDEGFSLALYRPSRERGYCHKLGCGRRVAGLL